MTQAVVSDLKKQSDKIELKNLIFYKKLGAGHFGSVYLVKHSDFDDFMALKCVSKQKVVELDVETHIQVNKSTYLVFNNIQLLLARKNYYGIHKFSIL